MIGPDGRCPVDEVQGKPFVIRFPYIGALNGILPAEKLAPFFSPTAFVSDHARLKFDMQR